jgi:hypothetical protein
MPRSFLNGFDWTKAPVEVTRIFHLRVKAFMEKALRVNTGKAGILGRVTDYMIRYEVRWGSMRGRQAWGRSA